MNTKRFIRIALMFMVTNLFIIHCSEAVEVQLSANTNEEAIKKIDEFFKNKPFPDSAYNVEIGKDVSVEGSNIKILFRVVPNQQYFNDLSKIVSQVSSPENEVKKKRMYGIKIFSDEYYISREIGDYIIRLIGHVDSFSIIFPLSIRYEFKDENKQTVQTSDIKYTVAYARTASNVLGRRTTLFQGFHGDIINFDFRGDSEIGTDRDNKQVLELKVKPEQIKEIVASVAISQKKKEEKTKRQKQLEEEQKRREAWEAEEKIREEGRKKQEEAKEQWRKTLLPKCNNKILTQEEFLMGKNPYADKDKCVEFMAGTFQMTSANAGLFKISSDELAYIEFNKTFRGVYVKGIAKIKGIYEYSSRIGTLNQVPHLEMLEIEEVRE